MVRSSVALYDESWELFYEAKIVEYKLGITGVARSVIDTDYPKIIQLAKEAGIETSLTQVKVDSHNKDWREYIDSMKVKNV